MDMMRPKVTVCVPVYNSEMYIERCVRSLLEQTLKDVEFIFVNDCSTDSTGEILACTKCGYVIKANKNNL